MNVHLSYPRDGAPLSCRCSIGHDHDNDALVAQVEANLKDVTKSLWGTPNLSGGWCAPTDLYPDFSVVRGGIRFPLPVADGKPATTLSERQLEHLRRNTRLKPPSPELYPPVKPPQPTPCRCGLQHYERNEVNNADTAVAAELNRRAEAKEIADKLAIVDAFGDEDPYVDDEVITFKKTMPLRYGRLKTYSYAAIRAEGKWYLTGATHGGNSGLTWLELVRFLVEGIPTTEVTPLVVAVPPSAALGVKDLDTSPIPIAAPVEPTKPQMAFDTPVAVKDEKPYVKPSWDGPLVTEHRNFQDEPPL